MCGSRLDGRGHERDVVESGVARAVRDEGDDTAEMRRNSREVRRCDVDGRTHGPQDWARGWCEVGTGGETCVNDEGQDKPGMLDEDGTWGAGVREAASLDGWRRHRRTTGCDVDGHRAAWCPSGSAGGRRAWGKMDGESQAMEQTAAGARCGNDRQCKAAYT